MLNANFLLFLMIFLKEQIFSWHIVRLNCQDNHFEMIIFWLLQLISFNWMSKLSLEVHLNILICPITLFSHYHSNSLKCDKIPYLCLLMSNRRDRSIFSCYWFTAFRTTFNACIECVLFYWNHALTRTDT